MKSIIPVLCLMIATSPLFAQFADTAALNDYIRQTMKDRRPDKLVGNELQIAFIGITSFLKVNEGEEEGAHTIDTLTRAEAEERVTEATLVPGRLYCISNADVTLYGGTRILIKAISDRQFGEDGLGYFYNPDYRNGVYTIWNGEYTGVTINSITGTFHTGEFISIGPSDYGEWIKPGLILTKEPAGPLPMETPLTVNGFESGATAEIEIISVEEYTIGEKAIWGGYVWTNLTGNRGSAGDPFMLNEPDWEKIPYGSPEYVQAIDPIKYDWKHDAIIGRREEAGDNEVYAAYHALYEMAYLEHPIAYFQWGNPFSPDLNNGIGTQRIIDGLNNNINFMGSFQIEVDIREKSCMHPTLVLYGSQYNIEMRDQSQQFYYYLLSGAQSNITLTNSWMGTFLLDGSTQSDFTLYNSKMTNFQVGSAQNNINVWGRIWDRAYQTIELEQNVFKFPFAIQRQSQTNLRQLTEELSTSSSTVVCEELTYPLQGGKSYSFEYELTIVSDLLDNTVNFQLELPEGDSQFITYTFYNLITGATTYAYSTTSGDASLEVNGPGEQFRIKITGAVKNVEEGNATLSFSTEETNVNSFRIQPGSHAKFTKSAF